MSLRNRVLSILNGKQPDRVPWLGDLDYWFKYLEASGRLGEEYKCDDGIYKLHRDLGVGFYLQGYWPFKPVYAPEVQYSETETGNERVTVVKTPVGEVRQVWKYLPESYAWGPHEHFIKDAGDLKVIRYWYEHTRYEPDYGLARSRYSSVGENGLVLCYLPRSPLMQMVAELAGIEAATYAMLEDQEEFDETLDLLFRKADEAAQLALDSPAECLMIPENLSSELVGKKLHNSYMKEYETKWNSRIKAEGKYSFVHMDGTMRGLISEVADTGFTVLEALTPAPVGDIEFGDIHKWVGEKTIIWGGIPGVFFTDSISEEEFDSFVIGVLEVMKSEPRYVLGVADQVPPFVRPERIKRVSQLVERYGVY